ncbi:Ribose ABC transport system, permease protein RbsC (TC 3.A.1.2.1) [Microbacterium esteraromaticum]|uniref:Ribose ABC transport system, permease protein RbsC (TC 3.A.1.2.1) n=1 Tax=Microbacterium esteraromaticum TaxID=57043 RepID=A0A1R4K719_9MICO|nr:ABC transporter permease [Microbacterium esteraromaticum]SJN40130.1 Ribose ABC transport system, permease protein RbsC (TC 3.A.1.2.1) [Microbacterium esteraromaticum]
MSNPQQSGSTTTVVQQAVSENTDKRDVSGMLKRQLQQSLAFGTLVVLVLIFSIASPNFFTFSNIASVLLSTAVIGILALGTTFVIITGGIDLSLGTGMALCAVMTGVFITNMGLPIWVGVLGGIATGVLMGLVNGVNVTYLRLPPFIATLAMMMIAGGLALVISGVAPIYFSTSAPSFKLIALGTIIPGIPNAVLVTALLAIIAFVVLSRTLLGRYTFAIGSNEEATRLSGVNTRRWTIFVYMLSGAFTGVAGIIIASRLDSAQPQIGMGYELQAIAAVIIGGTSLLGGRGSIIGTVIGALIMSVLVNGLSILSIKTEWRDIVIGIVVLIAVFFDSLRNRQRT